MDEKKDNTSEGATYTTDNGNQSKERISCFNFDGEGDWENILKNEKYGSYGDMTFCMADHIKETMQMTFMMRSHHMLTDVCLEVGTELFYAHKIILAAASPYFKVSISYKFLFI